jgi:hypothetical protein
LPSVSMYRTGAARPPRPWGRAACSTYMPQGSSQSLPLHGRG